MFTSNLRTLTKRIFSSSEKALIVKLYKVDQGTLIFAGFLRFYKLYKNTAFINYNTFNNSINVFCKLLCVAIIVLVFS